MSTKLNIYRQRIDIKTATHTNEKVGKLIVKLQEVHVIDTHKVHQQARIIGHDMTADRLDDIRDKTETDHRVTVILQDMRGLVVLRIVKDHVHLVRYNQKIMVTLITLVNDGELIDVR